MTKTEDEIVKLIAPQLPVGADIGGETPLWHKDVSFLVGDDSRINATEEYLDSLDRVEIAMAVEDFFGIEISDAETVDYAKFGTVSAIAAFVDAKVSEKRG